MMFMPRKIFQYFVCILIGLILPFTASANSADVILLTLEWPPFTSGKLPDNGFISKRVTTAYSATNHTAHIGIFNWRQAIRLPYTDKRFIGFFPVYPSQERKRVCHLSDPIGVSELGLAERKQAPLIWNNTDDLIRYRIGIVDAYSNDDSLDTLIEENKVKSVVSNSDTENLINLAQKKVDGIVIDTKVFQWLLENDKRLAPYRRQLQMNKRLLIVWPLHICFRKDAHGAKQRDVFNQGLMKSPESRF